MLDHMRLQFDIGVLVARSEEGSITINETEYEEIAGKVIACKQDPKERTVTYTLEEFDPAVHGDGASSEEGEPDAETVDEVEETVNEARAETQH